MKPMWTPNYQVCIYILPKPNLYILGQNTALLIPATKHDSYQLEIFTLVWWGLRLLFWWSNSQRRYRIRAPLEWDIIPECGVNNCPSVHPSVRPSVRLVRPPTNYHENSISFDNFYFLVWYLIQMLNITQPHGLPTTIFFASMEFLRM